MKVERLVRRRAMQINRRAEDRDLRDERRRDETDDQRNQHYTTLLLETRRAEGSIIALKAMLLSSFRIPVTPELVRRRA